MAATLNVQQIAASRPGPEREKALKILAKSIFKELKSQGYDNRQIVGFATEMISLVTNDIASENDSSR
jgi:hypothetical protein